MHAWTGALKNFKKARDMEESDFDEMDQDHLDRMFEEKDTPKMIDVTLLSL